MTGVLIGSLLVLLFLTVPIFASLCICTLVVFAVFFAGSGMETMLAQSIVTSCDSFPLMAIPFFMLVGTLMSKTGIAGKLVAVAEAVTGDSPGGLGNAAIIACMLFAAISGSGPATAAAIGGLMIPAMVEQGYPSKYAGALVASGSTIGPVIPPSIPLIMYAVTVGVSTSTLFTAGFIPGIMMGIGLIIYNKLVSKKSGYRGAVKATTAKEKLKIMKEAIWALLMPVIVLGGIYSGLFTPTESAVVGVVYSLFVGKFIYKTLTFNNYVEAVIEAGITSATIMILFGGANTFGRILTIGKIPETITSAMLSVTDNTAIILLLINFLLLLAGMFIDTNSSMILFAPIIVPIMQTLGYDPIFIGIMMCINLCIGMLTPPLGPNLFISQRVAGVKLEEILPESLKQVVILYIVLAVMILFPQTVMFLPKLLGMV